MADNGTDAKQKRAENRRRRRSEESGATEAESPTQETPVKDGDGDGPDAMHQAARAAAAAAAVGAAVGAVRAIASRVDDGHHEDEPEEAAPEEGESEADQPEQDESRQDESPQDGPQQDGPQQDGPQQDESRQEQPDESEGGPDEPAADDRRGRRRPKPEPRREPEPPRHGASARDAAAVVRRAREQLEALQGTAPESVSSLERMRDGWRVRLEVVEVHRVPDSTDVLAGYEVELDDDGGLLGYRRVQRYYRSQAERGGDA